MPENAHSGSTSFKGRGRRWDQAEGEVDLDAWMEEPGGLQSMGSQRVGHD